MSDERRPDRSAVDLRDHADRIRRLVGPDLTAYLVNQASVDELDLLLDKADGHAEQDLQPRLDLVIGLASTFRRANATARFRAWLREVDTGLGLTCPAVLIRDGAPPEVGARLDRAARRYLSLA